MNQELITNNEIKENIIKSVIDIINHYDINEIIDVTDDINNDDIITNNTKKLLSEFYNNQELYFDTQLTYKHIVCIIWNFINTLESKNYIKEILNIEINNCDCSCFKGRISSLIYSLNRFTNLVNLNCNKQISNIYSITRKKLELENNYSTEIHKEIFIIKLKELKFSDKIINEWVSYF